MRVFRVLTTLVCLCIFCFTGNVTAEDHFVANAPDQICPILIGSQLPEITLQDISGKSVDLNQVIAEKPTVLIYFRGGW